MRVRIAKVGLTAIPLPFLPLFSSPYSFSPIHIHPSSCLLTPACLPACLPGSQDFDVTLLIQLTILYFIFIITFYEDR